MTLAALRKKYVGKRVSDSYANQHSIPINLDADPEYQYFAEVTIDDDRKITHISRMSGRRLMGDDATRVNYENIRINADDYDLIEDEIESLLDPNEVIEDEIEHVENTSKTDEDRLCEAVRQLDVLQETAHRTSIYINTDYVRQQIKELMEEIAEKEHRFFTIVSEYDPKRSRQALVLKETTAKEKETSGGTEQ